MSDAAPAELFEPEVMALFDKYKRPLYSLFTYYCAGGASLNLASFITMAQNFDISPTFLTKKELRAIHTDAARAHASAPGGRADAGAGGGEGLSYAAFVEALGRLALIALSKPAFQRLYPTPRSKVAVLLEMWGLADQRKLQEVQVRAGAPEGRVA
uniref:Uncharacterized protein n=1 Tax=Bicosoecida sp. CB-2014 TaxID=1486930 RepID=A0A7S1CMI6_9STRA